MQAKSDQVWLKWNRHHMRITEQIDALEVMGINSSSYLVLPKIVASILMYPLLVILSGVCAIIGGYLVEHFYRNHYSYRIRLRPFVSDLTTLRSLSPLPNHSCSPS